MSLLILKSIAWWAKAIELLVERLLLGPESELIAASQRNNAMGLKATLLWVGQYPLIPQEQTFARRLRTAASCLSEHWSKESLIRPWSRML